MSEPSPSFFIDYPKPKDVAAGDLLAFDGLWRKVIQVDGDEFSISIKIEGAPGNNFISAHYFPLPRIAGPLLDALKKNRDPYR